MKPAHHLVHSTYQTATDHLQVVRPDLVGPQHDLLEPGFPYGEDLLQYIWASLSFDRHALRTVDGAQVEILAPGRVQRNSGPDLAGAQIRIGGQLWAGTVEVHLRSSEWFAHGHQTDPAYDNVVLHVVYEHDAEVRTSSGRTIPTVELMPRISTDSIALHHALMTSRSFIPCASQIGQVDRIRQELWLERVLVERLERKTAYVEEVHLRLGQDPLETFHHMLLQAFGMKVNAEPFEMLANVLPVRILLKYRDDDMRMEALLFGQAGMLQVDLVEDHARRLQQEYRHLARLHELKPMPLAAWKFGRLRPINFPTIRLAQYAQVFKRCDGDLSLLLNTGDVHGLRDLLDVEASEYWTTHYVLDRPSKALAKRLGRAAADHLIINAIVPSLFALGRLTGREEMRERSIALLEQLPAEKNAILSAWAGLGIPAGTAGRGQALLEQRNSYCSARRCLNCGFGNELLKRTSPYKDHRTE